MQMTEKVRKNASVKSWHKTWLIENQSQTYDLYYKCVIDVLWIIFIGLHIGFAHLFFNCLYFLTGTE